ncbi:hypothetical protein [Embleya sp. NBC_00896]|uniref:hypothetical protein n=1 Tax=Embleya sp. NBC_00896 TaxID=2975961 RepID=UPI00386300B2|nr:hypothetical protein OG928_24165 [Embleya sp. NBC_00896]
MGILQGESGMTISVYRIKANGEREVLKPPHHYEVHADDPRPAYPANDPPCECDRCEAVRISKPM